MLSLRSLRAGVAGRLVGNWTMAIGQWLKGTKFRHQHFLSNDHVGSLGEIRFVTSLVFPWLLLKAFPT